MRELIATLAKLVPPARLITDPLRRLAYGTDASFYRLVPEAVVVVETEEEVRQLLAACQQAKCPVTFRAAGTSLSGQAISRGVLALLGERWATCEIAPDASSVRLGPALIGAEANRRLAPFGRKIGPDPASINTAKIGGIAANNASGMCCGTAQNSYRTLRGMRILFADGSVLDSEDAASVVAFRDSHGALLARLDELGRATRANAALAERIRHKFKIKNTTGYSLNALVDFDDPLDILTHLMIGSEGTLGFIARITYNTVVEHAHKASALVFFPDIETACQAVIRLKTQPVAAVELLDRPALRSVENKPGLPALIRTLGPDAAALLIETRAEEAAELTQQIDLVLASLRGLSTIEPPTFSTDPAECAMFWNVRKGTFPSVGAMRKAGTTVIIEDVAFPVATLAAATRDLQALFKQHGYHEAIIFGHALEGNLHFVFTQDFSDPAEVERYRRFMDDVCQLVVGKYDGSLKAEHGTGRNMAPFVELEWGVEATQLMREIKQLFDPHNQLNPGVILNDDPEAHLRDLKPMPAAAASVDRCIECGFCEPQCPSHGLTLSPRQRIVGWREISRRRGAGENAAELLDDYLYRGMDTCAGCGLCSTACPVGIETGALIRELRAERRGAASHAVGRWVAGHFAATETLARAALAAGHVAASLIGDDLLARLSRGAWRPPMPHAGPGGRYQTVSSGDPVVYFPTCAGRIFGSSAAGEDALPTVVARVMIRAGYAPIVPERSHSLCCGQAMASKGLAAEADSQAEALEAALLAATQGGQYPVVLDASPCALRLKKRQEALAAPRLKIYDLVEFAHDALLPRLRLTRQSEPVALHVNCSSRRMGNEDKLRAVINACAEQVVQPASVNCCGFGGDRGFVVPELNRFALRKLADELPEACRCGYSSNRTCEIGLTAETGVNYRSIIYLLDECSREEASPC